MNSKYFLHVSTIGIYTTVLLNGVPLVTDSTGEGVDETMPVNSYLMSVGNALEVMLSPMVPSDGAAGLVTTEQRVQVSLFLSDPGSETVKVAEQLCVFNWPIDHAPQPLPYASTQTIDTTLDVNPGMVLWNHTNLINKVTEDDKRAMYASLHHQANLLKDRKLQEAFNFMKVKYHDESLADGKPIERLEASVMELWQWMLSLEGIQYHEVKLNELAFNIVGRGHMVSVTRLNGEPAIVFEDTEDDVFFGVPLYFANVNEQWRIVR